MRWSIDRKVEKQRAYHEFKARREMARMEWHRWFAWRPVKIDRACVRDIIVPAHRVWLEYVERRASSSGYSYSYRTLGEE